MPLKGNIDTQMIDRFNKDYLKNQSRQVIKNSIIKNGLKATTLNANAVRNMQHTFSEEIKTGKATSQKSSGRCWMFAGLNVFRQKISEELNIKDFELSQVYPMFWDKLEKSNYFLENIIATVDEDIYSRLLMWLLADPIQDGGQWDMFANLITKYGVVPQYAMPETFHSSSSYIMNRAITLKLREYASTLRQKHKDGSSLVDLKSMKMDMLNEIYRMLVYFLGEPPTIFDFEYRNEDKEFHFERNLTPQEYFKKYVKLDLDNFVSVINAPTADKPFNQTFTVQYLGNVIGGKDILYLNVENDILKQLAVAQLKDKKPVWFGCDVGKMLDTENGIMEKDLYDYETAFETAFALDKAARLDYRESLLTHAMVFTGVNLVDDKPNRWKVENSWSDKSGKEGYYVMGDSWFDEYNYQIVIEKSYLPDELKQALEQPPVVLPPWDPMGSLAMMQ
ncbi:C1 family peptidase [candidate division KSB1 bacterium]|nr:C1 family peptidase [candidate division KSB1 bacterium]